MHGAPALRSKRHHSRAPHGREYPDRLLDRSLREVHQQVLLASTDLDGVQPELDLLEEFAVLVRQPGPGNQHGLGPEYLLDLLQTIGHQSAARRNDIENRVCDARSGSYLHRACDNLYLRIYPVVSQILPKDVGVGGSDALAVEILRPVILLCLRDSQADAASAESQPLDYLHIDALLLDLVKADDTQGCGAGGDDLRDVVVTHIKDFQREVRGLRKEFALRIVHGDTYLLEQRGTLFVQPSFGLNGYSKHNSTIIKKSLPPNGKPLILHYSSHARPGLPLPFGMVMMSQCCMCVSTHNFR